MIVAIDPNIFIAASRGHLKSEALLDEILEAEKYLEIGVDEENQELQKVYERLANDPDINGTALDFLKWLLDDWERRTEELPASTAHSNFTLLDGLGCGTPVEPHLIAVATESGRKAWLFLVGSCAYSKFLVTRGLHDSTILSKLKSHASYASIDVFTAVNARIHLHTWLKGGPMYPSDESQLESYLRTEDYREKVHLEFKQPEDDPDVDALTFNILEKSMTEVCAIANTVRTGKVMIGIYEEKKRGVARGITAGFPQAYRRKKTDKLKPKSKNQIMDDILWSKNLLKKFTPEFGVDELRMNIIDLDNGRVVLIIHIENSKEPRQFGSECYVRRNTKSEKIDFAKMQQMWQDGLIY